MQEHSLIDHKDLRDEVGDQGVYSEPTQQIQSQAAAAAYTVITFTGLTLLPRFYGLIHSKWSRSYRHGNEMIKLIDPQAYYETYKKLISNILSNPDTTVRLAVADDYDTVFGFCISRKNVLDYMHVLRIRLQTPTGIQVVDDRKHGIGTALLPKGIDTFTHLTKTAHTIWDNKYPKWKFNPFA